MKHSVQTISMLSEAIRGYRGAGILGGGANFIPGYTEQNPLREAGR